MEAVERILFMNTFYIFTPAKCPFCNKLFYLNSNQTEAYCIYCGQPISVFTAIQNYDPLHDGALLHTESTDQERQLLHAEQLLELFQNHHSGKDFSEVVKCYQKISADYPRCSFAWWQQFRLVCCQNFNPNRYLELHISQIIDRSFMEELNYLSEHTFYQFALRYATDSEKQRYHQQFLSFYQACSSFYQEKSLLTHLQNDDFLPLRGIWLAESEDKKISPNYLEFWNNESCIYLIAGRQNGKELSFARLSYRQPDEHCESPYFKIMSGQEDFHWMKKIPIHPLSSTKRLHLDKITYCRAPEDFEFSSFRLKLLRFLVYIGIQFH